MAEAVSCFLLPQWSSWLCPHTATPQAEICPSASLKFFPVLLSPAVLAHVVQKHPLVCRGSSATIHLPRTQIKELRVCCHFQFLWGSGSPGGCLFGAIRNSKEDLQIWTLALSERNGRKFTFVNPLHCFWMYSQALRWISCPDSGCCFCRIWFTSRVLSRHSARKLLETVPPCIPSWGKISLKCGETAQSRDQVKWSGQSVGPDSNGFSPRAG